MNHYCADSDSKWITSVQTQALNESLLCRRITTAQTRAPNESLLRRLGLQTNHYCADSGSRRITTAQTRAPNESLLRRLGLQTNHYCADLDSKRITTVQTRTPNYVIGARWHRPHLRYFGFTFLQWKKVRMHCSSSSPWLKHATYLIFKLAGQAFSSERLSWQTFYLVHQ